MEAKTLASTCHKGKHNLMVQQVSQSAETSPSPSRICSDIDLVVVSSTIDYQRRESVLRSMAACLRRNNLATDVQVIAKAKVPIIKFVCTHGKYRVDVSVNQSNGVAAATYVNDWLRRVPAIRPLVMVTKHLLSQRGMSEVFSGGLGSYSVICMVISFLQVRMDSSQW